MKKRFCKLFFIFLFFSCENLDDVQLIMEIESTINYSLPYQQIEGEIIKILTQLNNISMKNLQKWEMGYNQQLYIYQKLFAYDKISKNDFINKSKDIYDLWLDNNPNDTKRLFSLSILRFYSDEQKIALAHFEKIYDSNHKYDQTNPSVEDVMNYISGLFLNKITKKDFENSIYNHFFEYTEEDFITLFVGY